MLLCASGWIEDLHIFFFHLFVTILSTILKKTWRNSYAKNVSSHLIKNMISKIETLVVEMLKGSFVAVCLFSILDVQTFSSEKNRCSMVAILCFTICIIFMYSPQIPTSSYMPLFGQNIWIFLAFER